MGPRGMNLSARHPSPGPWAWPPGPEPGLGSAEEFHGHTGSSPQSGEQCNYFNNFASFTWYLAVSSGLLSTSTKIVWIYVITQMVGIFSLL